MKRIISQVNLLTPLSKLVSSRSPTMLAASDPKVGPVPGPNDHGGGGAALHAGSEEAKVGQIEGVLNAPGRRVGIALDGQCLTGERGLIEEQILGGQHPDISRHHVTGCQPDDIALHQQRGREFLFLGVPHHRCRVAHHCSERLGCVIGPHLLKEAQHDAEHHHHEDDGGGPQIAREKRQHAQGHEQEDQWVLDVSQEPRHGRLTLPTGNLIGSEPFQASDGFLRAQSAGLRDEPR
jgi:hypothetical protein